MSPTRSPTGKRRFKRGRPLLLVRQPSFLSSQPEVPLLSDSGHVTHNRAVKAGNHSLPAAAAALLLLLQPLLLARCVADTGGGGDRKKKRQLTDSFKRASSSRAEV